MPEVANIYKAVKAGRKRWETPTKHTHLSQYQPGLPHSCPACRAERSRFWDHLGTGFFSPAGSKLPRTRLVAQPATWGCPQPQPPAPWSLNSEYLESELIYYWIKGGMSVHLQLECIRCLPENALFCHLVSSEKNPAHVLQAHSALLPKLYRSVRRCASKNRKSILPQTKECFCRLLTAVHAFVLALSDGFCPCGFLTTLDAFDEVNCLPQNALADRLLLWQLQRCAGALCILENGNVRLHWVFVDLWLFYFQWLIWWSLGTVWRLRVDILGKK